MRPLFCNQQRNQKPASTSHSLLHMASISCRVMNSEHSTALAMQTVSLTLRARTHTRPFMPTAISKGICLPSEGRRLQSGLNSFL